MYSFHVLYEFFSFLALCKICKGITSHLRVKFIFFLYFSHFPFILSNKRRLLCVNQRIFVPFVEKPFKKKVISLFVSVLASFHSFSTSYFSHLLFVWKEKERCYNLHLFGICKLEKFSRIFTEHKVSCEFVWTLFKQ